MIVANFGQYLSSLALLWCGFLLLSRITRSTKLARHSFLSFVLRTFKKLVLILAIITTSALILFVVDVKEVLSFARQAVGKDIELLLRDCIDIVFNTRSFFTVIQICINSLLVISTVICEVAMFVGHLACLCIVLLRHAQRATKVLPQKQQSAQTFTTNAYNYQRKYFIRA